MKLNNTVTDWRNSVSLIKAVLLNVRKKVNNKFSDKNVESSLLASLFKAQDKLNTASRSATSYMNAWSPRDEKDSRQEGAGTTRPVLAVEAA